MLFHLLSDSSHWFSQPCHEDNSDAASPSKSIVNGLGYWQKVWSQLSSWFFLTLKRRLETEQLLPALLGSRADFCCVLQMAGRLFHLSQAMGNKLFQLLGWAADTFSSGWGVSGASKSHLSQWKAKILPVSLCCSPMTWKEPKARSYSREVFAPKSNYRSLNSVISWVVIRFHANVWRGTMILQRFTRFPQGSISFCHEWKVVCALSFPQYCDIFSAVQKFWTMVSLGFYDCLLYFLSFNVLDLPEPELTQSRLHQEWQKFAIWFTFVTTKEIAMISVNLGCKVAAASVVTFWRICATRSPFLHPVSIQCHLLG